MNTCSCICWEIVFYFYWILCIIFIPVFYWGCLFLLIFLACYILRTLMLCLWCWSKYAFSVYHLISIGKMINGISVIPKFWFTFEFKFIIISSDLFKVSIFCHRNLDNAVSALNCGHFIAVTKKSISESLAYLSGFHLLFLLTSRHWPSIIDFPISLSFLSSSFGLLSIALLNGQVFVR